MAGNGAASFVCASTSAASQPAMVRSRIAPKASTWFAAVRDSASKASANTSSATSTSSNVKPRECSASTCIHRDQGKTAIGFAVKLPALREIGQAQLQPERRQLARGKTHQLRLLRKILADDNGVAVAAQR